MEGKLLREGRERARGARSQVLASPSCVVVVSASQRTLLSPWGEGQPPGGPVVHSLDSRGGIPAPEGPRVSLNP